MESKATENGYQREMKPILIYYHVFCNENTIHILRDQITKIVYSGLYEAATSIQCFLSSNSNVRDTEYMNECCALLQSQGDKFIICQRNENDTTYERRTLESIPSTVASNVNVLYIHTKGITKKTKEEQDYVWNWRNAMEYHLIKNYVECVKYLELYDCVGCIWRVDPMPHFSGNMWWARGEYLKTLPLKIGPEYLDPELWIGLQSPRVKCVYDVMGHPTVRERFPELKTILHDHSDARLFSEVSAKYMATETRFGTDKCTSHSYERVYDSLFQLLKYTKRNILEIGISGGYGLLAYRDYFKNAMIYGIDIEDNCNQEAKLDPRIKLLFGDACAPETIQTFNTTYDLIIEDGSHLPEHQIQHFKDYSGFVNVGGYYIIEDVKGEYLEDVMNGIRETAEEHGFVVQVADLREIKNRSDDILIVCLR